MKYKKVYIEITNYCNLSCSFCHNNRRTKQYMTTDKFAYIIEQIKPYTKYVYLHVKGEPLLHPNLKEILTICDCAGIKVNITTNGTLIQKTKETLKKVGCVRQINFSLHSENNSSTYFTDIFSCAKQLSSKMYISYRLWTLRNYELDKKSTKVVEKIIQEYNLSPEMVEKIYEDSSIKIDFNTFVDKENLFEWPSVDSKTKTHGFCYGLKTHFGILVDGTVVPCCLDGEGTISLGNIFEESLERILNGDRTRRIIKQFQKNKCSEEFCQKCQFKNRFMEH